MLLFSSKQLAKQPLFSRAAFFSYTGAAHLHGWEPQECNATKLTEERMDEINVTYEAVFKIKLRDLPKLHAQRTVTLAVYVEGRLVATSKWRGLSAI